MCSLKNVCWVSPLHHAVGMPWGLDDSPCRHELCIPVVPQALVLSRLWGIQGEHQVRPVFHARS